MTQNKYDDMYVIVPSHGFYCHKAGQRHKASWAIYTHGDSEPLGNFIARSCSYHLGSVIHPYKNQPTD